MADVDRNSEVKDPSSVPSSYLKVNCVSSGKIRRFSVGTDAGFALSIINRELDDGLPLALCIEAVKEGEEPITFGPNSVLVCYGHGWTLQTLIEAEGGPRTRPSSRESSPPVCRRELSPPKFGGLHFFDVQSAPDLNGLHSFDYLLEPDLDVLHFFNEKSAPDLDVLHFFDVKSAPDSDGRSFDEGSSRVSIAEYIGKVLLAFCCLRLGQFSQKLSRIFPGLSSLSTLPCDFSEGRKEGSCST